MIRSLKNIVKGFTAFDSVVLGFIIFGLAASADVNKGMVVCRVFIPISLFLIIKGVFKTGLKFPNISAFYKCLFCFYWVLLFVMVVRGYMAPYSYWTTPVKVVYDHLFNPTFLLGYMMPLFFLLPIHNIQFKTIYFLNVILMIFFLVMYVLSFNEIKNVAFAAQFEGGENWVSPAVFISTIYTPILFVAFLNTYTPRKLFALNIICLSLCILSVIISARRGAVLTLGFYMVITLMCFFKNHKKYLIVLLCVFSLILLLPVVQNYISDFLLVFDYIQERGFENTRSVIDDELLAQLDIIDRIFGRGLLGRYRMQYDVVSDAHGFRYYTETGFYYLVLRGGYLFAFTHILLIAIPALKGLFKAKNDMVKMWAIFMLWSLVELYPFGWPSFGLKFLFVWLGCAVCMNNRLLRMNDRQVYLLFFSKQISQFSRFKKLILNS